MEVHSLSDQPGQNLCLWEVQQPVTSNTSQEVRKPCQKIVYSACISNRRSDLKWNLCFQSSAHLRGRAQLPPGWQSPRWGGWGLEVWPQLGEQALCLCPRARLLTRAEARTGWEDMRRQLLQEELARIQLNRENYERSTWFIDLVTLFRIAPNAICLNWRWKPDIPESFVGAGDNGGAASFMGGELKDSVAMSFDASQSDFLFKEPIAGFI